MTDRIACCVPFCRRTTRDTGRFREWICGPHWSPVDPQLRRLHSAAKRRAALRRDELAFRTSGRIWQRCQRQAIERAAGIG